MKISHILLVVIITLSTSSIFASQELPMPLVETDWLVNHLEEVIVLDVRTNKKSFLAKPSFHKNKKTGKQTLSRVGGHIPGAQLVIYKNVRGDQQVNGKTIKHMMVSNKKFETIMQKVGVNQDSKIVITSNAESGFDLTMASRMYWQIKFYGHEDVSILNGGTAQWIVDGHDIASSPPKILSGNWKAKEEHNSILATSIDVDMAIKNNDIQLVDVRGLGQYLGANKSSKAKAKGHIPTAKVFPVDLLSSNSSPVKFSSKTELTQLSNALGVNPQQELIAYCNSGHMASGGWFVFHELLGNENVKLYDGSMHQWTLEDRPVVSMKME